MSTPRAVIWITSLSIAASMLMTAVMLWMLGVADNAWSRVLLIAAVMPLLLATLIGVIFMRLVHELDAARKLVHQMAIKDGLTGITNRAHFMELAEQEFAKAMRHQLDLSVAMLDADLFKGINDAHGHLIGDAVLRGIGEVTAKVLRDGDVLARYGGEEFVVLLPLTGAASAAVVAERMRRAVADMQVENEAGVPVAVTVSIGTATLAPGAAAVNDLLASADKALYLAKANGRNRVEHTLQLRP